MWARIDGTEVLTHLVTTLDLGQDPTKNFFTTYNGQLHPTPSWAAGSATSKRTSTTIS